MERRPRYIEPMRTRAGFVASLSILCLLTSAGCESSDAADAATPVDSGDVDARVDEMDGDAGDASAPACNVIAPTRCPSPAPTWDDVQPIFIARCAGCHTGAMDEPWSLSDYSHVASWALEVRGQLISCNMPPMPEENPLDDDERLLILEWIFCGAQP